MMHLAASVCNPRCKGKINEQCHAPSDAFKPPLICANCKKIRDDAGLWTRIENYLSEHTQALISHGLCPECIKELYPEIADKINDQQHAAGDDEPHR